MPSLAERAASPLVKIMMIGNSGAGKTGALSSLVPRYKLRILDLDNGLDSLVNHVPAQHHSSISFMSFRDRYIAGPMGPTIQGAPTAYVNAIKALEKWEDGSKPAEWGSDSILVIDSLTALSNACMAWAQASNPNSKEPRQWFYSAQGSLETVFSLLTAESFRTNVIIIGHVDLRTMPDNSVQGFATSIGKSLGPKIPRYFNTMVALEAVGQGATVSRKIRTLPTALIPSLKNPAPSRVKLEYPIATGMADLFRDLTSTGAN